MSENDTGTFPPIVCFRCTRRCNLSCKFCFASNHGRELTTEEIKKMISSLKERGTKSIRLGGGEPTMRPDLNEIILFSKSINLGLTISSNLYNVGNVYDTIVRNQIPVLTSIHGDMNYHDNITGRNGAYNRVCENIRKFRADSVPVTVHFVLMPDNFLYVRSVIERCIELKVDKVTFQTCLPRENGKNIVSQNSDRNTIIESLFLIKSLAYQYDGLIRIKTINMYEKFYYVLEPDRVIYLEKSSDEDDTACYTI